MQQRGKIMRKLLGIMLVFAMLLSITACGEKTETKTSEEQSQTEAKAESEFHIGVVTGTVSQAEDEQRGAEAMIEKYGNTDSGGMINLQNYPDNFAAEYETTVQTITGFADDEKMKVIVVNQGVPGTAAAFKQIREKRPDILLFVGNSQEDPGTIEPVADWISDPNNVVRGYLVPLCAKKLGAKKFVHVSFPRHMSIELLSLRRDIMRAACDKIGLEYVDETAPDPMSDVGITGAQQYILEHAPAWIKEHGKDTAFFATNDAQTEPLLKKVYEEGAMFIEQDLPSPILGYTGALGLDLKDVAGNWPEILKRVEAAVIEKGGKDRMGTWAYSFGYSTTQALIEFGKRIVEGKCEKNMEGLLECYREYTPGADWNGSLYVDRTSKNESDNHALVYQDTYVFGKGYMGMTKEEYPDIYEMLEEYQNKNK